MASMKQALGGKYLKSIIDIGEDDMPLCTVRDVQMEKMQNGDTCTVLYFHEDLASNGDNKGYVANKGITKKLIQWFGDDTDAIIGHRFLLFSVETQDSSGQATTGLRIKKAPAQSSAMASATEIASTTGFEGEESAF